MKQDIPLSPAEPTVAAATEMIPLHSAVDNRLLDWLTPEAVGLLIRQRRATLVRDRHGRLRRAYLKIEPGDENDPQVYDLMGKTIASRKTVYRQKLGETRWCWRHKYYGAGLEALRTLSNRELALDAILGSDLARSANKEKT